MLIIQRDNDIIFFLFFFSFFNDNKFHPHSPTLSSFLRDSSVRFYIYIFFSAFEISLVYRTYVFHTKCLAMICFSPELPLFLVFLSIDFLSYTHLFIHSFSCYYLSSFRSPLFRCSPFLFPIQFPFGFAHN